MQGLNTEIYRKHMKRYSTSLITREREIKTTIRHYYIPIGMAKILKTDHSKHWWECEAIKTLISVDGKVKWYNHFGKQFGYKFGYNVRHLPCDLAIPLSGS